MNLDSTNLTQSNLNLRCCILLANTCIDCAETLAEILLCLGNAHVVQIYQTEVIDTDISIWRDNLRDCSLICTPNIDNDLITRTELVVCRSGDILIWSKSKMTSVEDVVTKDNLLLNIRSLDINQILCCKQILCIKHLLVLDCLCLRLCSSLLCSILILGSVAQTILSYSNILTACRCSL